MTGKRLVIFQNPFRKTPKAKAHEKEARPLPERKEPAESIKPEIALPAGRTIDVSGYYAVALILLCILVTLCVLFFLLNIGVGLDGAASFSIAAFFAVGAALLVILALKRQRLSKIFASGGVSALIAGALPSAMPDATIRYQRGNESLSLSLGMLDQAWSLLIGVAIAVVLIGIALHIAKTE